ncbi:hypothetical protein BDV12DRAFT_170595 [Aspergillus spectabilis]
MPLLRSCKNIAWGLVPCCGRRQDRELDSKLSEEEDEYPHTTSAPTSTQPYDDRNIQRKDIRRTQNSRRNHNHQPFPLPTSTTREDEFADNRIQDKPQNIKERIFFYDIMVFSPDPEKIIYRRTLLDFTLDLDAISDEIPHVLNLPIDPYRRSEEVKLPNGKYVRPIGTLDAKWQLYNGDKPHTTHFLVIKNSHFDMLLGRSSIKKYKLWEWDRDIKKKLQYRG